MKSYKIDNSFFLKIFNELINKKSNINLNNNYEFIYRNLSKEEEENILEEVKREISLASKKKVGEHRKKIWSDAWKDVYQEYIKELNLDSLNPSFIGKSKVLRFDGNYILPISDNFELNFYSYIRNILGQIFFENINHVYEFGCGSAFNLAYFSKTYKEINFYGTDWAISSIKIIESLKNDHKLKIDGFYFDFFHPNYLLNIHPNSIFLTMCALEQIGSNFNPIIDFFINKKPKLVIHLEPIVDFYNPQNPFDDLAMKYHKERGYLLGFYEKLIELEKNKTIDIIFSKRIRFGSLFQESYSLIVWQPKT